ncbi:MAG: ATP phosphoribosyltransferase regulatory subunit, partial [Dehalococcoidales bacterium]|nr:ATP phosphoribosyltransferase regulatory subunit [Dehalococcoidales bacterium]
MKVQRCKGTRDLSPKEMIKFRLIEEIFRNCCLNWGYDEVRTPTLEYFQLFTSTGTLTPSMLNKVYSFLDWDGWSGERVVLRPDGTIPVARLFIENMTDKELAKLFYVANIFRFEETGRKTRERWQCGVELIGINTAIADVELIALAMEVMKKLELKDVELKLSHAGLIKAVLENLNLSSNQQVKILDQILDGDTEALARLKIEENEQTKMLISLLDLKGKSSGFLKNLKASFAGDFPNLGAQFDDFISIVELLEMLGYNCQI